MNKEKLSETLSKAFEVKENAAMESNEMENTSSMDDIFGVGVGIPVKGEDADTIDIPSFEDEIQELNNLDSSKESEPVTEEPEMEKSPLASMLDIQFDIPITPEHSEEIIDGEEELQLAVDVESQDGNTAEVVKDESTECEPSQEKAATEAETEEEKRAKEATKRKTLEDDFKKERQTAIERLEKQGITIDTRLGKVKLTTSLDGGFELFMKAIKPRKSSLVYKLYEVNENGVSDEMENNKVLLNSSDLENSNTKVLKYIENLQGYYAPISSDIKINMSQIVKYKMLKPVEADVEVLTGEQIVELLKKWIEDHIIDPRVAIFKMGGHIHATIVKRGEKTPGKIFAEIINEIAPANKVLAVKDWLYENNFFNHDINDKCKDIQKNLSKKVIKEIRAESDKCISFNFEQEYLDYLYKMSRAQRMYLIEEGRIAFDVDDEFYIDDTDEFFIGDDGELYIIDEREAR